MTYRRAWKARAAAYRPSCSQHIFRVAAVVLRLMEFTADQIAELKQSIARKTILFSEKENKNVADFDVFIIDTIGILTKIYSEADIAYVGGGFGNPGVHNILEPATFGVPIVIGPNFSHFAEATALVGMGGCISISDARELTDNLENLIHNIDIRHEKGHICETFVRMNTGATSSILRYFDII